jgi:RNA polymerase sigma-70 factor (ECF subfamily)
MASDASEDRLLARVAEGDSAALTELIERFQPAVFRLAYRTLGEAAAADDACADVFAKLWFKAKTFRGGSLASTWLYRLAVRTILDAARNRQRWWKRLWRAWRGRPAASSDAGDPAQRLPLTEEAAAANRRLHAALAQLNEPDRILVHLFYFEERGLAEIEAILDVPEATLKMRLHRARQKLRELLT